MPLFEQVQIRDEGVVQGFVMTMDFVGAGVAVAVAGGVATVTISGSGNTIYTGDGTIAGARAIALNGNAVAFNQGAEPFLKIDPTANAETTFIRAFNTTGGDNYGRVVTSTSATNAQAYLEASFNGSAQIGGILLIADATSARLTYTAATHTFTGGVSITGDIDVATVGTRWGSQSFGASGEFPACALIGSFSGSVTIFPSYSTVTAGSKVIIGYWSGAVRSAFEVANVASGNGVAYIMKTGGNVGIGVSATTARLHLPAGSATASTGPLKFTSGTLLGTTEAGAIEYDGTHLYFTAANAATRYQLDQQSGGGGWGTTGTIATLTGASTLDLGGNWIAFAGPNGDFLKLDPTVDAESATLDAYNNTAAGNDAFFGLNTTPTTAEGNFNIRFDGGAKQVQILANVDGSTATLAYTADTHTFVAPSLFTIGTGNDQLFYLDAPNSNGQMRMVDSLGSGAESGLDVYAVPGSDMYFNIFSDNNDDPVVSIKGDSDAQTITLTSATTIVSNLAGTGSRAVLADATGTLSAPISDFSVKENVMDLTYGLDVLSKLRPVSFTFKDEWKRYGEGMRIGFIAQEIESILPNSVFTTPLTGKMGYNETDIIPILVKAIQEQQSEIKILKLQLSKN